MKETERRIHKLESKIENTHPKIKFAIMDTFGHFVTSNGEMMNENLFLKKYGNCIDEIHLQYVGFDISKI